MNSQKIKVTTAGLYDTLKVLRYTVVYRGRRFYIYDSQYQFLNYTLRSSSSLSGGRRGPSAVRLMAAASANDCL